MLLKNQQIYCICKRISDVVFLKSVLSKCSNSVLCDITIISLNIENRIGNFETFVFKKQNVVNQEARTSFFVPLLLIRTPVAELIKTNMILVTVKETLVNVADCFSEKLWITFPYAFP